MPTSLQHLGRTVKRLQHRHHRTLDTRLLEIGTTLAQWDALRAISQNPEASLHALAEFTFQTDQSFGALVVKLRDARLVTRKPGKGRALYHALTASGEDVMERATAIAEEVLRKSFAPLNPSERAQLLLLLTRLLPESE